jgi:hypothetical protein
MNKDITDMAEKAKKFLNSKEGKKKLEEAAKNAKEMSEKLDKQRKIDPKKLNEPMTI